MANLRGKYLKCGMYLHQQMLFFAENYIFKCRTLLDVDTNQLTLSHRNLVCSRYPICGCMLLFGGAMRGMSGVPFFCFSRGPLSVPYSVTNTYLCEASLCAPYQFVCHLFLASITQVGIYLSIDHILKQKLWLADTVVCQTAVDTGQQGGWHLSLSLTTGLTSFSVACNEYTEWTYMYM